MIRLSGSVKLYWSWSLGPSRGGSGGFPVGFFSGGLLLGLARGELGFVVGARRNKPLFGAFFHGLFGLA
ncbi:MAG: hypothetical protein ACO3JG_00720, partial [Luteolibacter sp.]